MINYSRCKCQYETDIITTSESSPLYFCAINTYKIGKYLEKVLNTEDIICIIIDYLCDPTIHLQLIP